MFRPGSPRCTSGMSLTTTFPNGELPSTTREIRLAARPLGAATAETFELATSRLHPPMAGQVVVKNLWMSVDPYMRGRMDAGESYLPAFEVGEPLEGSAVGEVVASAAADLPVGTTVVHFQGWREHAVVDAAAATPIDPDLAPLQTWLGVLGTTGLSAYLALTETAPVRAGDVVWISSAAGAVGAVAGRVARSLGARTVIGSAGGPEKVALATDELGYDKAIDYRAGDLAGQLRRVAPDGIDVYLDAVGGDHLEAAIDVMNVGGRIAAVGAISQYDAESPRPGPRNTYSIATKRLSVRGFLVTDHLDRFPEWINQALRMLDEGTLTQVDTVIDGLENAPQAFLDMMAGRSRGKMLVRLADNAAPTGERR